MNEYERGLREVGDEELESIIQEAEKHLPHSITVHNLLSIGFRLKLVDRNYTQIYLPVSEKLPFFIIITGVVMKPKRQNLSIFWDPAEISNENAKTLMKSLPNWDWQQPVLFNQSSLRTLQAVKKIMLGEEGLGSNKLRLEVRDGYTYKLSSENMEYKAQDKNIFISKLSEEYAPLVFKHWIYYNDSEAGIRNYMKALPAMAAFAKVDSNESCENHDLTFSKEMNTVNGLYKPVSWVVCRFYGELGFSFTLPEYRSKGLCGAITLALAKEVIKMNLTPYINITGNNPASIKAHENIGFKKYCPVGYHVYLEKGMEWKEF